MVEARRVSGGRLVYDELRRRILTLELEPGRRLYEPELSTELRVSRTPLREALRLLLAEDLLEQLPTGGMVVRAVSATDVAELYGVRAALEGLMAAEAAARLTDEDERDLRALVERNARLVELPEDAMNAGHAFHARIARAAGHGWAERLHGQIDGHMERYRRYSNSSDDRRHAALDEHRSILEALASRDPVAARATAEAHVLAARDATLASVSESLPR
jgi:DNA-binding GntR family transcriptional regulator